MAVPGVIQIDDRNPLIYYSPNASWTRGGNASDYDATSTFTSTPGASASITFSGRVQSFHIYVLTNWTTKGIGISVWGTIDRLDTPAFVLSSYSVDGGPTTTYNATVQPQFQFQQNFFQSGTLTPASHTLVVTYLTSNGRYFIDYFFITPSNSPITATSTSPVSSSSSSVSTSITAGNSHSSGVRIAPIVGGSLGGLALIIIMVLVVLVIWLRNKRVKKNQPDCE